MKLSRFTGFATLAFLLVLVSTSCSMFGQQQSGLSGPAGARQKPPTIVSVVPVKEGKIATVLTYSGNIQPQTQVNVVPKSSGRVEKVLVDVGAEVKAGDVLAELDHNTLDAQLKQAEANVSAASARVELLKSGPTSVDLASAQAAVAAAQARLDKARADLSRLKNPVTEDEKTAVRAAVEKAAAALQKAQADYDRVAYRPDVGALPQATTLQQATIDYQAALANYNVKMSPRPEDVTASERALASAEADLATAQAKFDQLKNGPSEADLTNLKAAQASLAQAQAALEVARAQRVDATITAPFAGIVSQKFLSEGALASASSPVVTLVSKNVEVALSIEEARIGQVSVGQKVELSVPAYPNQTFPGKVVNVSPTADPKSHTFLIKVAPDQQDGKLKAGMFAEIKLTTEQKENAVLVPRDAVVQKGGKSLVFVVADGKAKAVEPKMGLVDDKNVEVVSGLAIGEQIITAGFTNLNDGDAVRIAGQQGQQVEPGQQRQGPPGKTGKPGGDGQPQGQGKPQQSGPNQ